LAYNLQILTLFILIYQFSTFSAGMWNTKRIHSEY